jgi:hypothetical protein
MEKDGSFQVRFGHADNNAGKIIKVQINENMIAIDSNIPMLEVPG